MGVPKRKMSKMRLRTRKAANRFHAAKLSKCGQCGADLHACSNCESYDPGATFECRQVIAARVSPKDAANSCQKFAPRYTVERQNGSTRAAPSSSRKAFDELFKF